MAMDDNKIFDLLWDRAEQALDTLKESYGKRLYQTAYNILGDARDAEEVVSDTYFAVWNAIPPQRPASLSGFVHKTGRNLALKKLRFLSAQKRSSHLETSLEELSGCLRGSSLEETLDARLLGQAIDHFLSTLDSRNRRIFLKRYWFGDRIPEIAKEEGLSVNALTVRLSRLREQLKNYLNQEGIFL